MDNQQERLAKNFIDIGWLTGMIDGEGSIRMARRKRRNEHRKGRINYVPEVTISNTSKEAMERFRGICQGYRIGGHLCLHSVQTKSWKTRWSIKICGLKRCNKMLHLISDHLTIKTKQARIVMEWIDYRLSLPKKSHHTEKDTVYYDKVKELNRRGPLPESSTTNTPNPKNLGRYSLNLQETARASFAASRS